MRPVLVYTLLDDRWHVAFGLTTEEWTEPERGRHANVMVRWKGTLRFENHIEHLRNRCSAHCFVEFGESHLLENDIRSEMNRSSESEVFERYKLEELESILREFQTQRPNEKRTS